MTGTDVAAHVPERVPMTVATMGDDEINRLYRIAKALAASGVFKDIKQAEQAFAKILVGRDLGLSPTQAMMGLHFVEGKPEIAAVTLAGFVQRHPGYSYRVVEHDREHCKIEFRDGEESVSFAERELLGVSEFTMGDARDAQLVKDHPKAPWNAHPRNMLFARAMSNGVKWFCPEVTGGIPVYHEGEIQHVENLAAGTGSGEAPGVELPKPVEAVIARAKQLGHAGLSDRATVEMTLAAQPEERVQVWVRKATEDLDRLGAAQDLLESVEIAQGADSEPDDAPRAGNYTPKSCLAPGPAGNSCYLVKGHNGHHYAGGEGWDSFLPEDPLTAPAGPDIVEVVDGEIVAEVDKAKAATSLNDRALAKQDAADAARELGDEDGALALEEEAEGMRAEAVALGMPEQEEMGL